MSREIILGIVRHILTIAGGLLVQRGAIDPADAQTLTGAGLALAGVAWSIYTKTQTAKGKP